MKYHQEITEKWERAARAEDHERAQDLKSAYAKVSRLRAKRAHLRREQPVTLSLTSGELAALKQFMMRCYEEPTPCSKCNGEGYINRHANLPDEPCPECNR